MLGTFKQLWDFGNLIQPLVQYVYKSWNENSNKRDVAAERRAIATSLRNEGTRLGIRIPLTDSPSDIDITKAQSLISGRRRQIGQSLRSEASRIKCSINLSDVPNDSQINAAMSAIGTRKQEIRRHRALVIMTIIILGVLAAIYFIG